LAPISSLSAFLSAFLSASAFACPRSCMLFFAEYSLEVFYSHCVGSFSSRILRGLTRLSNTLF
jgi:hypothetical protein